MESQSDPAPLVVIVGQTASGKSSLAINLAQRFNGEIVCADSRTVYQGMDIGTAKPTPDDQLKVQHHLIDIVQPDHLFTANDFQKAAQTAIKVIHNRGKLAVVVGGTGLYIDSILYDFSFRRGSTSNRAQLETLSVAQLQALISSQNLALPKNDRNPRHLIRVIESGAVAHTRRELRPNTLVIGLEVDKDMLAERIAIRTDHMLKAGLENEVRHLREKYGWNCPALQTIGYQEFKDYLEGHISLEQVRDDIMLHTRQYAKRQKTWFKRNPDIQWICKTEDAVDLVTTFLNKSYTP